MHCPRSIPSSLETKALACALLASILSLAAALLVAAPIRATASSSLDPSPLLLTPQLLTQAHSYFTQSCGDCHGDDAHGDEGPDLHNLTISNARIATTIKNGVKGEMPSFAKKYTPEQIGALAAYVRSLH